MTHMTKSNKQTELLWELLSSILIHDDIIGSLVELKGEEVIKETFPEDYKQWKEEQEEEILCGVGDTNNWSPKGCRCVLNIDDANYMDDGRGTAYYCDECYIEKDEED